MTKNDSGSRVVQLLPADGWRAVLAVTPEQPVGSLPLVAWALLEDAGGGRRVEGLVAWRRPVDPLVTPVHVEPAFLGYLPPPADDDPAWDAPGGYWDALGRQHFEATGRRRPPAGAEERG